MMECELDDARRIFTSGWTSVSNKRLRLDNFVIMRSSTGGIAPAA
jgi:hypothetical protein